jgi:hypothetical protein
MIYDPWFMQHIRGIFIGLLPIFILYLSKKHFIINKQNLFLLSLLMFFLVFSALPTVYNNSFDLSVIAMYVRMFLYSTFMYFLYSILPKKDTLIKYLKISVYFQFFIFLACFILPDFFKGFIYSLHTAEDFFYNSEQGYRLYFFTSMAFFQLSLFFGFLFNFMLNLYLEKKINLLTIILCFLCGLATGRSFIIFSVIAILLCSLNIKSVIAIMFGLLVIYITAINFQENKYIYHAFEPIIQYQSNKSFQTPSSDKLINEMLIMPSSEQFMFGDGKYINDDKSYYMHTDSGYLRQIFYGGILYLFSCLLMSIYLIKRVSNIWFKKNRLKFFISTLVIFSVGHIKADVFMYPGITLFLIILLSFYSEKKK